MRHPAPPHRWLLGIALAGMTLGLGAQKPNEGSPAVATATPSPSPTPALEPLRLNRTAYRLPTARPGKPYDQALHPHGGHPPYTFALVSGNLPPGLSLSPGGRVQGTPSATGPHTFTIRLGDAEQGSAQQTYTLAVSTPAPSAAAITVDRDTVLGDPSLAAGAVQVYRLTPAVLEKLQPPPEDEKAPALGPLDLVEEQIPRLKQLLSPLLGVEFPTRPLFEAALDAQIVSAAQALAQEAALKGNRKLSATELASLKAPDWTALEKAAQKADTPRRDPDQIPLCQLGASLLSLEQHQWVIEQATQVHLLEDPTLPPGAWKATRKGTTLQNLSGQIYGFYPTWWAKESPQAMDFSTLHRISIFALPFDEQGNLSVSSRWLKDRAPLLEAADHYRTRVDFTIFRQDWGFLRAKDKDEKTLTLIAQKSARDARAFIDQPLPGGFSRLKAQVPYFGSVSHVGDGLTLWLEPPRDAELRACFHQVCPLFIQAFIDELLKGDRPYTLNLVIPDQLMGQSGAFSGERLLTYLLRAEKPPLKDGRIDESSAYQSHSNLNLAFVVTLSEPSSQAKKELRERLEKVEALRGADRRIVLRKVIPVLSSLSQDQVQLRDDLAYLADNFGGVAFWPLPIQGEAGPAGLHQDLWASFSLAGGREPSIVACWVSEHRWALRILFEVLLLLGLGVVGLLLGICRFSALKRPYQVAILAELLLLVITSGLLLHGDPMLARLRDSGLLLWVLVAVLALAGSWTLFRPKVEKP